MKLSYKIKKSPDFILDYLSDMQKFVSVHPVITKMDHLGNNNYLVHETLKLGFIPVSFTYHASVESRPSEKTVTLRATVMKLTKIEMNFTIKSENEFSVVEENITFKTPLPVKKVMESIFKKQHAQLFKNMEAMN